MELQKIHDAFVAAGDQPIESGRGCIHWPGHGQQFRDHGDGRLDHQDARGFQRFQEAARKPHRHAIAHPLPRAIARLERDDAGGIGIMANIEP